MSFVPVYFRIGDRAIFESDGREPLQFAPIPSPKLLLHQSEIPDSTSDSDGLYAGDLPNDLKGYVAIHR